MPPPKFFLPPPPVPFLVCVGACNPSRTIFALSLRSLSRKTSSSFLSHDVRFVPFVTYDGLFLRPSSSQCGRSRGQRKPGRNRFSAALLPRESTPWEERRDGGLSALDTAGRGSGSVECVRGFGGRGKERGGRESSTEEEDLVAHCCASDVDICCVAKRTGKEKLS